jgi:prepilin-type N-terminal cleavage/methylation domain-containing protein
LGDKRYMKAYTTNNKAAGFTLIELMVVVLIIAVLAGVLIPILRGKIDNAKWSEANSAAGMIRNAFKEYYARTGVTLTGSLSDASIRETLSIGEKDLTGTYFVPSDYKIDSVDPSGVPTIMVTGSQSNAPSGTKTLYPDGKWQ